MASPLAPFRPNERLLLSVDVAEIGTALHEQSAMAAATIKSVFMVTPVVQ
ncbi:MAG: hypothetical protein ABI330_15555 [Caldimonas sp.]